MEYPELLTPEEVACAIRVSLRTLQEWRTRGTGPPFVRLGRGVFYPAAKLNAWLVSRTEAGAAA